MTRHKVLLSAAFIAALGISVSALPAQTAPEMQAANVPLAQTVQSAQVHTLLDASFHSVSIGF